MRFLVSSFYDGLCPLEGGVKEIPQGHEFLGGEVSEVDLQVRYLAGPRMEHDHVLSVAVILPHDDEELASLNLNPGVAIFSEPMILTVPRFTLSRLV